MSSNVNMDCTLCSVQNVESRVIIDIIIGIVIE